MEFLSPEKITSLIENYALPFIWAVIIYIVGRIAAQIISRVVAKMMTKAKVEETLVKFCTSLTYIAIMAFVILAALENWGSRQHHLSRFLRLPDWRSAFLCRGLSATLPPE